MTIILNIDKDKFSLNGIPYFKNFMPHVIDSKLRIVNVYDTNFELSPLASIDQYTVNGVVHTTVLALQTSLVSVVFSRDTLGAVNEFLLGSITPTSVPTGTGKAFWNATQAGTYTNFGGLVVNANSIATITRDGAGVFSISQTALDLTTYQKIVDGNKINAWTAKSYLSGDQVNYLGKDWVSNAATIAGDVPGTSTKWIERLIGKANLVVGKNLFNKATITLNTYVDNNGGVNASTGYDVSDYISVLASTQYTTNYNLRFVTYYDSNKVNITSTIINVLTFTTPVGTAFIRVSLAKPSTNLDLFQMEIGTTATTYESYARTVPSNQLNLSEYTKTTEIPALVVPLISNKADLITGKNKYNYLAGDTTIGLFLTATNNTQVNSGYSYTGYIPITAGVAYYCNKFSYNGGAYYHFYDTNKAFISSSNLLGTVAPVGAAYLRYSLNINTGFSTTQIEEGTVSTTYETYNKTLTPAQLNLSEYTKTVNLGAALPDASIAPKKTTFFVAGTNMFDKTNTGIVLGQYLLTAFTYAANAAYNSTPYITIDRPGTLYAGNNGSLADMRFLYFYDINKALISSFTASCNSVPVPSNAAFFRATYNISYGNYQLEIGTVFSNKYSPYLLVIDINKLPQSIKKDSIEVYLPPEICVGLGRTIELYHNQISICGNINNFTFLWTATTGGATPKTIGKTYKEKFSVNTSTSDVNYVGTYTLSLSVLDNDGNSVASASSVLKVVNKTSDIPTPLRYLGVGDSLTNKPWLPETRLLANNIFGKDVLHWVGSIAFGAQFSYPNPEYCRNEGRPGWRQDQYIGPGWGGAIKLYVSGVSVAPASKKQYYLNTVSNGAVIYEVEDVFNANGQLYSAFGGVITAITFNAVTSGNVVVTGTTTGGTATGVSGAVAGDATLTYSKYDNMDGNPFWNPATSAVDFAYYFTNKGIAEPDAFVTMLGTNAITDTESLITFVGLIQTQMPNKKVFVLLPQFPGDYLLNPSKKKQFFDFAKNISIAFASNTKVFIVPVAFTHDSAHNFGWLAEDINPRNSNYKNYMPLDTVHPQECGYFQFADSMFSTFLAHYNS